MCMCVCIYIYIYIYICICIDVYVCVSVHACIYVCVCMYVWVCACVCMYKYRGVVCNVFLLKTTIVHSQVLIVRLVHDINRCTDRHAPRRTLRYVRQPVTRLSR